MIAVGAILFCTILMQDRMDRAQFAETRSELETEKKALLEKAFALLGERLEIFVADYAPWDELAAYVAKPDPDWARVNLHDTQAYAQIDALWILRPDGSLVYTLSRGDTPERLAGLALPLAPDAVARLVSGKQTLRCFVRTPAGLAELRAAPIRRSNELEHFTTPAGWLVAIDIWDDERLATLSKLIGGQTRLSDTVPAPADSRQEAEVSLPLADWTGVPAAWLRGNFPSPALANLETDRNHDLLIYLACSGALLITLLLATSRWVIRPLRLLAQSLAEQNAAPLAPLAKGSREFARLAQLVEQHFARGDELRQAAFTFNAIDEAILVVDAGDKRILQANAGARRLFNRPQEAIIDQPLRLLLPDSAAAPGGLRYSRIEDGNGAARDIEWRRQGWKADSGLHREIIVARDATERLAYERNRLRAQRMESLGTLAGGVAHDLNNMLTPVLLVLEDMAEGRPPPSRELVSSVRASVQRGSSMLRQLLTFSRGSEGERRPVSLASLLADLANIVSSTFPKHIALDLPLLDQDLFVLGDLTQLHQVLLNLCVNARDAMPAGGSLALRARVRNIDADAEGRLADLRPGDYAEIEVRDTGCGIPPAVMERIFEPFFTTKPVGQGTGLGLSTALGIIRAHGGHLSLESRPGAGTVARILLPLVLSGPPAMSGPLASAPEGAGRAILVVDDEPLNRDLLGAHLAGAGFAVLFAADGEEGLAAYRAHQADIILVISDLVMPRMDGLEMIVRIRRLPSDVPAILASGFIDEARQRALAAASIATVLHKPFSISALNTAIRSALVSRPA